VASPLLANVYLHYIFDLRKRHWRERPISRAPVRLITDAA
jgi:hypothetical protein